MVKLLTGLFTWIGLAVLLHFIWNLDWGLSVASTLPLSLYTMAEQNLRPMRIRRAAILTPIGVMLLLVIVFPFVVRARLDLQPNEAADEAYWFFMWGLGWAGFSWGRLVQHRYGSPLPNPGRGSASIGRG
ncbi:MAG: hypothetical protein GF346_12755 [Candidatus Eisenbacteria bacterium]|nr:hypothetical protein [Candidatus Latescibacterota bacterium]MBD3303307.1 hypothetical protein [Candidatus Eisenbacteria bacterium]